MKGRSVCERQVIRRDVLEDLVVGTIGGLIRQMLEAADPREFREMVRQHLGMEAEATGGELGALREQATQLKAKINSILDNITEANREVANERIAELRKELAETTLRIEGMERAGAAKVDLDAATQEMLGYLRSFGEVMREGSMDERRAVVRAFVRQVRLDPQTHEGRAEIFALPDFEAVTRYQVTASKSSLRVVAGAPVVADKKRPGFAIEAFALSISSERQMGCGEVKKLCTPPPERSNTFGRVTPHPATAPSPLHPPEGIGTFGREWPSSPLAPDTLYRRQRKCLRPRHLVYP